MERGTSIGHIRAVLAIDDRVLRNYWVTQTYSDLSSDLAAILDPDTANWCTFGTWASCTVGRNLRGDELPEWLRERVVRPDGMMGVARAANEALRDQRLDRGLRWIRPEHVSDVVRELFGACATNLSEGNTKVFAEIAPAAATFIKCFGGKTHAPQTARRQVLKACDGVPEFEGVNRLRAGFAHWCDAITEPDPARRSQLILAGSLELGAHEQHHLQGPIAGSMDMGLNTSFELLKQRLIEEEPGPPAVREAVDAVLHPLGQAVNDVWGDVMTGLLGTIQTPDGTLRLDHDVPPLPDQAFVPPDLDHVVVDDLAALLLRFNRADDDGKGSRAIDWVDLDDRMNFITNLFRSRHHRAPLFQPPFAPDVLADIEADRTPRPLRSGPKTAAIPPSVGADLFTDAFVETLRTAGDPPADAGVATFFAETGSEHAALFRRLAKAPPREVPDEDLPGIGAFVKEEESWPEWASPELVRDGQAVFGEFGPQLGMGLFMASLPADYAFAKGVQALARTTRLTRDPKRRYVETGQMIIDVMTPGGLDPGHPGYVVVRHVRLMHAAVRHALLHGSDIEQEGGPALGPWDSELGLPISQLQLLGTLFSFGVQGIESLRRSGVRLSPYRSEAYIHAWNLVGHQLGIRDDLLPLSWEDSQRLWDERRRREYGPTPEGKELTLAAIDCMRELFSFSHLPGLPATGIRHYLGNETADLLGVPSADWTRLLFDLMGLTDFLYGLALFHIPGTGPVASMLGRRVWQGFEQYGRDGDRPSFEVTDELKAAWGMGT